MDFQRLARDLRFTSLDHDRLLLSAVGQRDRLDALLNSTTDEREILALLDLRFKVSGVINRILRQIGLVSHPYHRLLQEALTPLEFIQSGFIDNGIVRDGDSFFTVSEKSTINSPSLPAPRSRAKTDPTPHLQPFSFLGPAGLPLIEPLIDESGAIDSPPFSLTDDQWSIISPLIPPDPDLDHMHGDPPALILFNRWRFFFGPPGPLEIFAALEEYRRLTPPSVYNGHARASKRGRPFGDPRPLLDAIFWKLSTGRGWREIPSGCPPWRICQLYYRRLFRSGRLYTLLLALYHDLRSRSHLDPVSLVEEAALTLDPRNRVILASDVEPGWETQTSLLLLQVAHSARRRMDRKKQKH